MRYNIQRVIESLQKYQKENPDKKLIGEDELLSLSSATHKVNSIDYHIEKLEKLKIEADAGCSNISDAAKEIGVQRPTIYRWIDEGIIDRYVWERKLGNETVIDLNELRDNLIKIKNSKTQIISEL